MAATGRTRSRRRQRWPRRLASGGRGGAGGVTVDGRIRLLRIVFVIAFLAIGGKAIALASTEGNLARIALRQQLREIELPAHRGAILDRGGEQLAVGQLRRTIYATPYMLDDPAAAAADLSKVLRLTRRQGRALRGALRDRDSGFAYVARKVAPELAQRALALALPGVGAYPEEMRVYPMKHVAGQVVGYAGVDNQGLAGIEQRYEAALGGRDGRQVVIQDPAGHTLRTEQATPPLPGQDVRLTIDKSIQLTTEQILAETVRRFGAKGATAIVEDPHSGEILAMATVPFIDPNDFSASARAQRNRGLTDIYEPGSTFKVVTVAGALSEGLVTPTTAFTLPGQITVADRTVHESHPRGTERFTVRRILAESSNVGAVTLGLKLGRVRMGRWIEKFGFGRPTGIDFPGEVAGLLPQWSPSTIGNVPMGQGVSVTPLQMTAAYSALANDGVWQRPRLVAQIGTSSSRPAGRRRVVSAKVAAQLRGMMADVVSDGTGELAQIPGYQVAGKTGTAQKALPGGRGYSQTAYVASFIGMIPAGDPHLVVCVVVDEPTTIWGGEVAAPAFRRIAQFALQNLEIAP